MKAKELFKRLDNGNPYSYFKKGRKYVYFSTGGYSDNEEMIRELKMEICFNILLVEWRTGGHYKFKIPQNIEFDFVTNPSKKGE